MSERSVVRLDSERARRRRAHWHRVVVNACEQCGRNVLPVLDAPVDFDHWLDALPAGGLRLSLQPGASQRLADLAAPDDNHVVVAIGPEGGFSRQEHDALEDTGFVPISLGPRILRTETAALAIIAMLQSRWGDL